MIRSPRITLLLGIKNTFKLFDLLNGSIFYNSMHLTVHVVLTMLLCLLLLALSVTQIFKTVLTPLALGIMFIIHEIVSGLGLRFLAGTLPCGSMD